MLSCFRCDNMILQKSTTIQVGKCIFGYMNPAKTQISLRFRFEASHVFQTCFGWTDNTDQIGSISRKNKKYFNMSSGEKIRTPLFTALVSKS